MKFTKKTLAIVVALAIVLTSISMAVFADPTGEATVTTSFKVLKDGATDLTDESNWETSEYAKRGSTVRGDVYLTSDFVAGSIALLFAYDNSALQFDSSKHTQIAAGEWNIVSPSSVGLSGSFVDGKNTAQFCVNSGYVSSSDMEGKDFLYFSCSAYTTHKYDNTLILSFYFKIKEDASPYTLENTFGLFPDTTMTIDHYDAPSEISYIKDQTTEGVSSDDIGPRDKWTAADYDLTLVADSGSIKIGGIIKFNPEGGNWDGSSDVKEEGGFYKEAINALPTEPEYTGKNFVGWSTEEFVGTTAQVVDGVTYSGGNQAKLLSDDEGKALTFEQGDDVTTLYAVWSNVQYTVTFQNEDGSVLQSSKWDVGATPSYSGAAPEKVNPAAGKTYKWNAADGWTETIAEVTGDKTYTAKFSEEDQKFTITFVNEDGTTLQTLENVPYGETPAYSAGTPTKEATAEYTYSWDSADGWTETVVPATADKTYTAKFTATKNKYTAKFVNYDGSTLAIVPDVEYGTEPVYSGDTPTKPSADGKDYVFTGWSPDPKEGIKEDTTYTAQFSEKGQVFTITFVDEDGTTLQTLENVPYGTVPVYTEDEPTKAADADYTYEFDKWTPDVVAATENATYTATYKATYIPKQVKDTFSYINNDNGQVIGQPTVISGTEGEAYTVPGVAIPEGYELIPDFPGYWTSTGVFQSTDSNFTIKVAPKSFDIVFKDEDGNEGEPISVKYGDPIPEAPEVPNEITGEDGKVQIFDRWEASDGVSQPGGAMPAHEVTFTPVYTDKIYDFTVTYYKDEDHTNVYGNKTIKAGDPITGPDAGDPQKFGYKFTGWEGTDGLKVGDTMPEKDIELTAKWELDKGLIAAAVGGAVVAGAAGTIAAANTALVTGGAIVGGAALIGGGIYLANNTHRVTYMVDGEVYRTFFVIDGTKVIVPSDPSKDGYTFAGWDGEIPDSMPDHDISFNAKWVKGTSSANVDSDVPATGSATAGLSALAIISAATAAAYVISTRKKEEN